MDVTAHPLTTEELTEHAAKLSGTKPAELMSYAMVAVLRKGGLVVVSSDKHRNCIANMLGAAFIMMDEQPDCEPESPEIQEYTTPDGLRTQFIADDPE